MRRTMAVGGLCLLLAAAAWTQDPAEQVTFGNKQDCDPCVSPDGKALVFASNRTGEFNIYLMKLGEQGAFQLTRDKKDDRRPSWSTDGLRILFDSRRTGHGDLYEMARDGSAGYLQLTNRRDMAERPLFGSGDKGILFASAPYKAIQFRPKFEIAWIEDKNRSDSVRILCEGEDPAFSPDKKKVVFMSRRTKNKDIWIMNPDGGMQTQLTTDPGDDQQPVFSNGGTRILFTSNRAGNFDIWMMHTDGTNKRQITTSPEDETQPWWGADGHVYFTRDLGPGKSNIFRITAP